MFEAVVLLSATRQQGKTERLELRAKMKRYGLMGEEMGGRKTSAMEEKLL